MRLSFLFLLISVNVFAQAPAPKETMVRVRMERLLVDLKVAGQGLQVQENETYQRIAIPKFADDLKISRVQVGGNYLWKVIKSDGSEKLYGDNNLAIKGHALKRGSQLLPNYILLSGKKRTFDLIGVLPLEDYIVGVVSSEMPLSWPLETLKAQAIAARSYATAVMLERKNAIFHLESSVADQVFVHVAQGPDMDPLIRKASEAVKQTSHMVLLNPNKKTIKAFYHADCGGKTSSSVDVWGSKELQISVSDSACPRHPRTNWSYKLDKNEVQRVMQPKWGDFIISKIELVRKSDSDRVDNIRFWAANGEQRQMLAHLFREQFGFSSVRSTFFDIEMKEDTIQIQGKGFGHGVGLCQWGSRGLALRGMQYQQILNHYYPTLKIAQDLSSQIETVSNL